MFKRFVSMENRQLEFGFVFNSNPLSVDFTYEIEEGRDSTLNCGILTRLSETKPADDASRCAEMPLPDQSEGPLASAISDSAIIAAVASGSPPASESKAPEGTYLSLRWEPYSDEALALTEKLGAMVRTSRFGPRVKMEEAAGALVADLFRAIDNEPDGYGYRSISTDSFVGERIGRTPFRKVIDGLQAAELIHVVAGHRCRPIDGVEGRATRISPTNKLLDTAADFGINTGNFRDHFRPLPPVASVAYPIALKMASTKKYEFFGDKIPGKPMKVDRKSSTVRLNASVVNDINRVISQTRLNFEHHYFQRIFNNGDRAGVYYNQGGRLYAMGGGYQSKSQEDRAAITINGEPTVELDISGSHYTIAMALAGLPIDQTRDVYAVAGWPRIIVKLYVNASLGNGSALCRWPSFCREDYAEADTKTKANKFKNELQNTDAKYTGDLCKDYPIGKLRAAVLPNFPVFSALEKRGITWGLLQYKESEAIIGATHELCTIHGVPVLPVHDSLICPASKADLVERVMKEQFLKNVGVEPVVKRK